MSEKKPSLRDQIAALLMMQSVAPPSPSVRAVKRCDVPA